MFYISALLFVIGYIIYILRCPKIIKDFQTFRDFDIQGHGERELRFFIVEYIFNIKNNKYVYRNGKESKLTLAFIYKEFSDQDKKILNNDFEDANAIAENFMDEAKITKQKVPRLFSYARESAVHGSNFFSMLGSFIFFAIGIILFIIVAVDNSFYVYEYYLKLKVKIACNRR